MECVQPVQNPPVHGPTPFSVTCVGLCRLLCLGRQAWGAVTARILAPAACPLPPSGRPMFSDQNGSAQSTHHNRCEWGSPCTHGLETLYAGCDLCVYMGAYLFVSSPLHRAGCAAMHRFRRNHHFFACQTEFAPFRLSLAFQPDTVAYDLATRAAACLIGTHQ